MGKFIRLGHNLPGGTYYTRKRKEKRKMYEITKTQNTAGPYAFVMIKSYIRKFLANMPTVTVCGQLGRAFLSIYVMP